MDPNSIDKYDEYAPITNLKTENDITNSGGYGLNNLIAYGKEDNSDENKVKNDDEKLRILTAYQPSSKSNSDGFSSTSPFATITNSLNSSPPAIPMVQPVSMSQTLPLPMGHILPFSPTTKTEGEPRAHLPGNPLSNIPLLTLFNTPHGIPPNFFSGISDTKEEKISPPRVPPFMFPPHLLTNSPFLVPPGMMSPSPLGSPFSSPIGSPMQFPFNPFFAGRDLKRIKKWGRAKRAKGKVRIDPATGRKLITAITCIQCFNAKKKCIYADASAAQCNYCVNRNTECIKRLDRRCQKIWHESGRRARYARPVNKMGRTIDSMEQINEVKQELQMKDDMSMTPPTLIENANDLLQET